MTLRLLTTNNAKIIKGEKQGFKSYILHLAPASLSGFNTCPKASLGCQSACLNTAGRGGMFKQGETTNVIQKARIRKTKQFFLDRELFMLELYCDIKNAIKQSEKLGLTPVIRLNGTSDIIWEKIPLLGFKNIFEAFPNVQFYDYTKILKRDYSIPNYHLTFSKSESNDREVQKAIDNGVNVAIVFNQLPVHYYGVEVIDGDKNDLRFLDKTGVIVGLKAKGKAKKDNSGFVVHV